MSFTLALSLSFVFNTENNPIYPRLRPRSRVHNLDGTSQYVEENGINVLLYQWFNCHRDRAGRGAGGALAPLHF